MKIEKRLEKKLSLLFRCYLTTGGTGTGTGTGTDNPIETKPNPIPIPTLNPNPYIAAANLAKDIGFGVYDRIKQSGQPTQEAITRNSRALQEKSAMLQNAVQSLQLKELQKRESRARRIGAVLNGALGGGQ